MRKVNIPFHDRFKIAIASGNKIMTTRSKRYGHIGDYFILPETSIRCMIMGVEKMKLGFIVKNFFKEEGFNSEKDFIDFWITIHRTYEADKEYYLHTFRRY